MGMEVHLIVDGGTLEIREGYLTRGEAERQLKNGDFLMDPVVVESPMGLVERYFQFRGLAMPEDEFHALAFLTSELGELSDALVSSAGNWIRNTPDKDRNPEMEAGDVLMMLFVTMNRRGIDPLQGMINKFKSKGFTDGEVAHSKST